MRARPPRRPLVLGEPGALPIHVNKMRKPGCTEGAQDPRRRAQSSGFGDLPAVLTRSPHPGEEPHALRCLFLLRRHPVTHWMGEGGLASLARRCPGGVSAPGSLWAPQPAPHYPTPLLSMTHPGALQGLTRAPPALLHRLRMYLPRGLPPRSKTGVRGRSPPGWHLQASHTEPGFAAGA